MKASRLKMSGDKFSHYHKPFLRKEVAHFFEKTSKLSHT